MWTVIIEALDMLGTAGARVTDAQRDAPTPCTEWTVAQVLQHAAGDQLAWAAALGTGAGPQSNPFDPPGHLPGSVADLLAPAVAAATTAWTAVAPGNDPVPTPLPQGALPAATAAAACALDAAVHAWDVTAALATPRRSPEAGRRLAAGGPGDRRTAAPVRRLRPCPGTAGR